jgi:hypothetical protein
LRCVGVLYNPGRAISHPKSLAGMALYLNVTIFLRSPIGIKLRNGNSAASAFCLSRRKTFHINLSFAAIHLALHDLIVS